MRDFAKLSDQDRRDVFLQTAQRKQVNEVIFEKDFWVCWILDYLFQDSPWKDKLIFKGGTSLSKAYGVIERFSEDVDLILDWSLLGYSEEQVSEQRTNNKQSEFGKNVSAKTEQFLQNIFVSTASGELRQRLGNAIRLTQQEQSVLIEYPRAFTDSYIRPEIILEIGPKAVHIPNERRSIRPYAADYFPNLFTVPTTSVCTVGAERTFWEKATILHQEANRPADKAMPERYSRHYYDLYQLSLSPICDEAIKQVALLSSVADFKSKFFHCGWAKYEEAKPRSLKLVPPVDRLQSLKKDYTNMTAMFFGTAPDFDGILEGLTQLESRINSLPTSGSESR